MFPVGDKVVLEKAELPESGGIYLGSGGVVLARVVAVGKGIPYGRGEFYAPTLVAGDLVFVQEKEWEQAPSLRIKIGNPTAKNLKVLHERQVLTQVEQEDL